MRNTGMREGSIKRHLSIHKKRLTAAAAAVLAVIVLLASIPVMQAQAVFDESTAVRFRTYKQSNTIENSIIFIGTHLINIQAMTDELYEKAVQSQSDSDQQEVYYKSELSDGTWYNITDATGLSDITVEGTPVNESELDDLFVAYYTGSDGITKNAKTGETVCIFDDPNPYDLLKLEELEIIRQVRSQAYSEEEEGVHKYLYRSLNSFFANDVTNETTRECDRALKNLQRLYEAYCTAGMDEDAQVISSLMEAVDATRRAEVYAKVSQDGEPQKVTVNMWFTNTTYTIPNYSLLTDLSNTVSGEYYDSGQYDDEDFRLDSELLDAVVTSIGECNSSYTSYASKALAPGGTTIRSYIYDQMRALVDLCEDAGSISLDSNIIGLVNNIKYAQNIENGVVGDADAEAKLLDDQFIPTEADAYTKVLQTGVSAEYQAAVNANKSDAAKKPILDNDALALDVARTALETMITAKKLRLSSSDAVNYIYERISWTYEQEKNIPKDDFAVYAKQSAADHIAWLTDMAKGIADEDVSQMSELDRLKTLLSDYLEKQQDAYDDGNLELAAQYKTLADDTSAKIAAEEARLNDIINSDTASEAEKAAAAVALGQTGLLSNINKLKNDALSAINTGDTDKLQSAVEMLATLGGENALNEIKNALDSSNLSSADKEKWSGKLDEAIASSKDSSLYDQANATQVADGSGATNAAGQGKDGLLGNIAKLQNAALNAVSQGKTGDLQSAIDLLAILGAENALSEVKNAVSASNLSSADKEKWTGKLNSAITSSRNSSIHAQANAAQESGGSAAENAAALASLGGSGLQDNITKLKNVAKSAVTQGETGNLQSAIDLLAMLGGEKALKEIKNAVSASKMSSADKDKWSGKLDEAIASSKDSSFYDKANATQVAVGSGAANAAGQGKDGLLGNIAKLKDVALNVASQGKTDGLESAIDLLAILGAENALNEIKNAVGSSNLSSADKEKWTEKLNVAITSSRNSSIHDQANAVQESGGSAAENEAALAALGGSKLQDNITKLKNVAKNAATQGETGSLQSAIDLLSMLGADEALNEVKNAVSSSDLSSADKEKWTGKLDEAIASSKDSSLNDQASAADGSGTESGSGSGAGGESGTGGGTGSSSGSSASSPVTMSERALTNAIEQVLGESFNELDDDGKSAAIAAMNRLYDEYKNVNAKKLASSYISKSVSERSPYVYTQLTGHSEAEYIPLSLIGTKPISSYRYVYSDSRQEATMTYGARSLRFRVGSDVVTLADGTQQKIKNYKVEFQNTPYIDENTAKTFFECEAEYITGTRYAICVTKKIKEQTDELYKELTGS